MHKMSERKFGSVDTVAPEVFRSYIAHKKMEHILVRTLET